MRSVNKVILIGNLTRDPELKTTSSGQTIVSFGLATNRQWTTSGGDKRDSAEFHELVAWAKLAEICKNYLRKGMLVYVEGYLKTRSWDMEDGTRRFKTEIVLQDMIILERRNGSDEFAPQDEMHGDMDMMMGEGTVDPISQIPQASTMEPMAERSAPGEIAASIDDDNMF